MSEMFIAEYGAYSVIRIHAKFSVTFCKPSISLSKRGKSVDFKLSVLRKSTRELNQNSFCFPPHRFVSFKHIFSKK